MPSLFHFATFVVACTVVLVLAGSLVTSTDSGLAVPDWPTSYGWSMFTFPPAMWVGGIFYEHGHRVIAAGLASGQCESTEAEQRCGQKAPAVNTGRGGSHYGHREAPWLGQPSFGYCSLP